MKLSKVDIAIVGAQKSGSSFFLKLLSRHPDVYCPDDEISVFSKRDWKQLVESHLNEQEMSFKSSGKSLYAIKRPDYLFRGDVPLRLHKHNPSMKIVVILRHPIERAYSSYFHNMRLGYIPLLHPNEGLRALLNSEHSLKYWRSHEVFDYSFYADGVERYLNAFSEEQVAIGFFDELRKDSRNFSNTILSQLGLDIEVPGFNYDSKPQMVIYSLERLKFLRLENEFRFTQDKYGTSLKWVKTSALENSFISIINEFDQKILLPNLGNDRPKIEDSLQQQLLEMFLPDVEALEQLLGISLDHWKQPVEKLRQ